MKSGRRIMLVALLLAAGLASDAALDRWSAGISEGPAGADLFRSFLGNLSYQVRGLAARLLYLKIDRYVHEGEPIDLGGGIFGVSMAGNEEIVPLYGIITYLDPHFMEAFSLGGNHLIYGLGLPEEGAELLRTGIAWNPDEPLTSELLGQLGVYLAKDLDKPALAVPILKRAVSLRRAAGQAPLPPGFVFGTRQLASLLAVACWQAGRPDEARGWLREPNLLPPDHEIFAALGVTPPHRELAAAPVEGPAPHEHGAAREHPDPMRDVDEHLGHPHEDPRWWISVERRSRFLARTATAALLVLALVAAPMAMRRVADPR